MRDPIKEIIDARNEFMSKTLEMPTHVIISGDDYDYMVNDANNKLSPKIESKLYKVYGMDIIRSCDLSKIAVVRI